TTKVVGRRARKELTAGRVYYAARFGVPDLRAGRPVSISRFRLCQVEHMSRLSVLVVAVVATLAAAPRASAPRTVNVPDRGGGVAATGYPPPGSQSIDQWSGS